MAAAGSESKMQADLPAQRAACERQIAAGRDPSAWAAFRAGLHSARSGAHQTFDRKGTPPSFLPHSPFQPAAPNAGDFRSPNEILQICGFSPSDIGEVSSPCRIAGDLAGLQKQLRDLEADLAQTLSRKSAHPG
jgi:hypothetical protein